MPEKKATKRCSKVRNAVPVPGAGEGAEGRQGDQPEWADYREDC